MEIDLATFKTFISNVTLDDVSLQRFLDSSKRAVVRDGFDVSHIDFDELQRLYAMGLLQEEKISGMVSATSSGSAPEGISSIGISGITVGFSQSANASKVDRLTGKIGYMADYEMLVRKIRKFKGRLV